MRSYEALFYTYFRWARALNLDPVPESSAVFALTLVVVFNIVSVLKVLEVYGDYHFHLVQGFWFPYIAVVLIFVANYLLLATKRRLATISARFEREQARSRTIQGIVAGFLFVEGLAAFLVTLWAL